MHVHTLITFFALAGAPDLAYHGQPTLYAHALSKDGSSISARGLAIALLDELAARSITAFVPLRTVDLERRAMSAEERRTKQATVREMIAGISRTNGEIRTLENDINTLQLTPQQIQEKKQKISALKLHNHRTSSAKADLVLELSRG